MQWLMQASISSMLNSPAQQTAFTSISGGNWKIRCPVNAGFPSCSSPTKSSSSHSEELPAGPGFSEGGRGEALHVPPRDQAPAPATPGSDTAEPQGLLWPISSHCHSQHKVDHASDKQWQYNCFLKYFKTGLGHLIYLEIKHLAVLPLLFFFFFWGNTSINSHCQRQSFCSTAVLSV